MATLTSIDLESAARIARGYGLELRGIEPLQAGSVNSNFALETDRGRFFMRIYEEQAATGARAELELLRGLHALGVPTTLPPLRSDGQALSEHAGKPVALYPWVDGDIVCTLQATPQRCQRIGAALAQVHVAGTQLSRALGGAAPEGRFGPAQLRQRLAFIQREASPALVSAAEAIASQLDRWEPERDPALPQGLIHGDLFRDNVLWRGSEVEALIDFESASFGVLAFDLMVVVLAWCFVDHFEPERVQALLAGYQGVRSMSAAERQGLLAEGALVALRFATTRITDYAMRTNPGEAPGRDYRRFLQRLAELQTPKLRELLLTDYSGLG